MCVQTLRVLRGAAPAIWCSVAVVLLAVLCVAQPPEKSLADIAREQQAKKAAEGKAKRVFNNDNLKSAAGTSLGDAPSASGKVPETAAEWNSEVESFSSSMEGFRTLNQQQFAQQLMSSNNPGLAWEAYPDRAQWEASLWAARLRFMEAASEYQTRWAFCRTLIAGNDAASAVQREACLTDLQRRRLLAQQMRNELNALAVKGRKAVQEHHAAVGSKSNPASGAKLPQKVAAKSADEPENKAPEKPKPVTAAKPPTPAKPPTASKPPGAQPLPTKQP